MSLTEAALLREVARLQHDKTLLMVRDALDSLKTETYDKARYRDVPRSAVSFKQELVAALQRLGEVE